LSGQRALKSMAQELPIELNALLLALDLFEAAVALGSSLALLKQLAHQPRVNVPKANPRAETEMLEELVDGEQPALRRLPLGGQLASE